MFKGMTMGTVYTVRVAGGPKAALSGLDAQIRARLEEINAGMSVYRPDSEISRFNALSGTRHPFAVSTDFQEVMRTCVDVHRLTKGGFDPTVKPLVDLWGFGPGSGPTVDLANRRVPDRAVISRKLESVGLHRIQMSSDLELRKLHPDVELDFGAVAKGYALDAIGRVLRRQGLTNFLVDIGGDILVSGHNAEGRLWRVGLSRPSREMVGEDVLMVLQPENKAVVTSGDYRQYFVQDGRHFSHILDPRTGRPPVNSVASVTVVADRAAFADALATGLMVLGETAGLELVETLPGVEALFLVRDSGEQMTEHRSSGFDTVVGGQAEAAEKSI